MSMLLASLAVALTLVMLDLYVDIALSYGLISFVGTLMLARYFETTGGSEEGVE